MDIASISTGLSLDENGIWCSASSKAISYPSDGNEACAIIEDGSFWFRHRNACICALVSNYPPKNGGPVFDVGGGNGFVSRGLIRAGFDVVLVEPGPIGCLNAKNRGVRDVVCATTDNAGFIEKALPAVGLFDVIEHIEDDLMFLRSMHELVEAGGCLYATVPAYSALWSREDDRAGHFRRYTLKSFSNILTLAGFEVKFATYIFRFLPIPILLQRAIPYRLGLRKGGRSPSANSRDHSVGSRKTRSLLDALFKSEIGNINKRKTMFLGGSCLVVAKCVK